MCRALNGTPDSRCIANLVMLEMGYLTQEQLRVLCLDTKNFVVAQQVVYQGTVNSSVVRAAEVFRPAVSRTCPALVVVHNHWGSVMLLLCFPYGILGRG